MSIRNHIARRRTRVRPIEESPRKRLMTPREYEAKRDLCALWDLMQQRISSAEIARRMGKDPAWVCRSIKRIQEDASTLYPRPGEAAIVAKNLATLESLLTCALKEAAERCGRTKILAIRAAADILRQKSEYEIRIGQVAPRTKRADGLDWDEKPLFQN